MLWAAVKGQGPITPSYVNKRPDRTQACPRPAAGRRTAEGSHGAGPSRR